MENNPQDADNAQYMDNAIRAVQQKKPLPEIDFTLHTMEDGNQVSTLERVCKGMLDYHVQRRCAATACRPAIDIAKLTPADPAVTARRPSSCLPPAL
jgi:hypothetical protein